MGDVYLSCTHKLIEGDSIPEACWYKTGGEAPDEYSWGVLCGPCQKVYEVSSPVDENGNWIIFSCPRIFRHRGEHYKCLLIGMHQDGHQFELPDVETYIPNNVMLEEPLYVDNAGHTAREFLKMVLGDEFCEHCGEDAETHGAEHDDQGNWRVKCQ